MKPAIIKDALPARQFLTLNDFIYDEIMWGNRSKEGAPEFWGSRDRNSLILYECASIIKLKVMRVLQRKIHILRAQVNGQTRGQEGVYHHDSNIPGVWSVLLFTNTDWNVEWGGEFVHFSASDGEYSYVPYIPNWAVLFDSREEHRGSAPNVLTSELRTSVAFMYAEDDVLEKAREENKWKNQLF